MKKKLFIETYGCQMNFSDSEIVSSIMSDINFDTVTDISEADIIFINTCSIRDNAEQRVRKRLKELQAMKKKRPGLKIGVLGCMAERLKDQLIKEELVVDVVAGPDSYRDLPQMVSTIEAGEKAVNVILSEEETYGDIEPVKYATNGVSAFISIMRGCENFCSYCVVPYTRGKERSRNPETIIAEARMLFDKGYREVTLLGQNVNSYRCTLGSEEINFAGLLGKVALVDPKLRVRFATSHPKDLSDELLYMMRRYDNICKAIHLPFQSGSDRMLKLMNRKYTREWYMDRISSIKRILPECSLSTDIIAGFCSEKEEDHQDTLSLMKWAGYDTAFMFKYSSRPNTAASKRFEDDVPEQVKGERLTEIINLQHQLSLANNKEDIGKVFEVLVESVSKKSDEQMAGRNSQNKVVVFDRGVCKPADYVHVRIVDCTPATLIGVVIENN